jgi:hypothetical protein
MARISGAPLNQGGLFSKLFRRIVYSLTRKKLGRVVMPVQITAHHAKLLWGYARWSNRLPTASWLMPN